MSMLRRPIPGQSLTAEPKSLPYERPPEVSDPEQALQIHLAKLNEPKRMDAILTLLENDIDLVTVVEGITRNGVANGIHSVDVSLIISPVIHEFIKTTADAIGIEYDEGFEKDDEEFKSYVIDATARKRVEKMSGETKTVAAEVEEIREEPEVVEEAPRGLMARM